MKISTKKSMTAQATLPLAKDVFKDVFGDLLG